MDITLFVGNGLDKALGLQTSYFDFYEWFKKQQHDNVFINLMKNRIRRRKDLWSDFEKGIGLFTNRFMDEGDLSNDYSPWKIDADKLLMNYLNNLNTSNEVKKILNTYNGVQHCYDIIQGAVLALKLMNPLLFSSEEEKVSFHVITLNYTDSLDQISSSLSQKNNSTFEFDSNVLHPHGRLSSEIILGVNDETQISNGNIKNDRNYSDIMIKSAQIQAKNPDEKEKALSLIDESTIVCLYGVSLGETDNDWWALLGNWLQKKENNRLVVLWYISDEHEDTARVRDAIHKVFLEKLRLSDEEKERLKEHIIIYFHKKKYLFASPNTLNIPLGNGANLSLIRVEHGVFTMSKNDGENAHNEKEHEAEIKKDFYIGETQVTQKQYLSLIDNNPSKFHGDQLPVEQVMWFDAMRFCAKLNEKGLAPVGYHFTLPTETQWEYAARGGKASKGYKYSGSNNADEVAWDMNNSSGITHEVKTKSPNELGIYDMSGNVWEWCLDDYVEDNSNAKPEFTRETDEKSSSNKVDRGGAHDCVMNRVGTRSNYDPNGQRFSIGFRVALVPDQY